MKTILVTVADDRTGRKQGLYGKTQDFIESTFREHPEFGIDLFLMNKWEDIKNSNYYEKYKNRLDITDPQMNGRLYKPLSIKEALSKIDEGDFLFYNDTSPELWDGIENINWDLYDLEVAKKLCLQNGGILTAHAEFDHDGIQCRSIGWPNEYNYERPGYHTHETFTSKKCRAIMDPDDKYKYCLQHASGFLVLQKNDKSVKYVEDWIYYNAMTDCCESYEVTSFEAHRTDQSISGILINRLENKLIRCLLGRDQHLVINPYNMLSFCQKNTDYKFIDSIQPMQNKRIYINENKKTLPNYFNKIFCDNWCVEYR